MLTNREVIEIAMTQSAIESNCDASDFKLSNNKVFVSSANSKARSYLSLPFQCDLTSYGNNIVASVSHELVDDVEKYINKYDIEHCFETPNIHVLNKVLQKHNLGICFMAEYFLPDMENFQPTKCNYQTRILEPVDFESYYLPKWNNALGSARKHLNMLAVGAFHNGELIGLAGCSADCDTMWQIGVDVVYEYRKKGIASALTSQLAFEILKRDIVPFYCCAWSNIKSVRNAIKSGLKPAWIQMTAKDLEFISEINN